MYPSLWGREAWEFSWKELTSQSKCSFCIYYFQFWARSCSESSFLSKDLPLASPWESWGAASLTSIFKWRIKASSISVALLQPQLVTGNWSQVSGHKPPICTALFFLYTAEGPLLLKTTSLVYVFSDKEKETRNYFKGVRIRNTLPSLHGYAPLKRHKLSPINKQKQAHKNLTLWANKSEGKTKQCPHWLVFSSACHFISKTCWSQSSKLFFIRTQYFSFGLHTANITQWPNGFIRKH